MIRVVAVAALCALTCLCASAASGGVRETGIHKIGHVIVIRQENRSFDTYFGAFPGADGIPKGVCVPDPARHTCDRPSTICSRRPAAASTSSPRRPSSASR